jgi:hypothetical protein
MTTAEATLYGAILAGVFGIFGTLLGVVLGLFGERWVRTRGKVRCDIRWRNTRGAGGPGSPGGFEVQQRQLEATFLNYKDVPVTVWEMRVDFYKGGEPLNDEERPQVEFAGSRGGTRPRFELATLHPRIPVTRTVIVSPGHNETVRQRAVEEADRIEFVAVIEGAKVKRKRLAPWNELEDQEERC